MNQQVDVSGLKIPIGAGSERAHPIPPNLIDLFHGSARSYLAGCGKTYSLMKSLSALCDKAGFLPFLIRTSRTR